MLGVGHPVHRTNDHRPARHLVQQGGEELDLFGCILFHFHFDYHRRTRRLRARIRGHTASLAVRTERDRFPVPRYHSDHALVDVDQKRV